MSGKKRLGIVSVLASMVLFILMFTAWDVWSIVLSYKTFGVWAAVVSALLPGISPLFWFVYLTGKETIWQGYNILSIATLLVGVYSFVSYHLVQSRYFKYPH